MATTVISKVAGTPDDSATILAQSGAELSTSSGTGEEIIGTYTLPANTMGANDAIRITMLWEQEAAGASNDVARAYFGTKLVFQESLAVTGGGTQWLTIVRAANSTSVQKSFKIDKEPFPAAATSSPIVSGAIDTTADVDITFRVNRANAGNTSNLTAYSIELLRAP